MGAAVAHTVQDGNVTKHMIHSHLEQPYTVEKLKIAKRVSSMIDQAFKDRGISELYTWAVTPEQHKYNTFLGYKRTGQQITIDGLTTNPSTYEYKKEL